MAKKTSVAIPTVLEFLRQNYGLEVTKSKIVEETKLSLAAVTASINYLRERGYVSERVESYEEQPATETRKAKIKTVRYETMTESGLAFDYDAYCEERAIKEAENFAAFKAARAAAKKNNKNTNNEEK